MAHQTVYTIVINSRRVEVSKDIYYAYQRIRDKERYQRQQIQMNELSLERFQEAGVSVECKNGAYHLGAEDEVMLLEERRNLYLALSMLDKKDWLLIEQLFFDELTEEDLARSLGITQQAVSKRKTKLLECLRMMLE